MVQKELNLGILAHVDAGKTSLTERLLYEAGVIGEVGSVDAGTTQTDSLVLEQQRGITIRSAVTSFALGPVHVNLIDTPGHPDFIAEVERVLGVLDGAVLVVSAVEGVQPQTRILMRALQRLGIPTLIFVNKIDRRGADPERVVEGISERLSAAVVQMGTASLLGTRAACFALSPNDDPGFRARLVEVAAESDERIMSAFVNGSAIADPELRGQLAELTRQAVVHPIFFGSAITGAGVEQLMGGIAELLPASQGDPKSPLSATVFKIERGANGEKVALARVFSGTIHIRDRLRVGRHEEKVTAVAVFERGQAVARSSVFAGAVARLWGLGKVQVGDTLGDHDAAGARPQFPPPTLESVVVSRTPADGVRLHEALAQLAEQDPLINVRQDDVRHEVSVSLYGDVQKEVIQSTLATEYGIDVTFREATTIYIERPVGRGEAVEVLYAKTKSNVTGNSSPDSSNPFLATLGLRVEPAPVGSGVEFRIDVNHRLLPIYVYKTVGAFIDHMQEYILGTLREGLGGWQVTDCTVTMTDCGYRAPGSTAADFRRLTPLVLMRALERAETVPCEPLLRVSLDLPTATIGAVAPELARIGATVELTSMHGDHSVIETVIPAARAQELNRQLPALTGGEGVLDTAFAGYQPVIGAGPTRPRTTPNPLNVDEYTMHLSGRAKAGS